MNFRIPILMYHQVSIEPNPNYLAYTVSKKSFSNQMKILKLLGFKPISISKLVDYIESDQDLSTKPIIITFDDFMQDAIENAVPVLESYEFTAVFYIPTSFIGRKSSWMIPDVAIEFQVDDWQTVKSLDSKGLEIGAHSMTHPHLTNISPEDCYKELKGSREILEQYLDHEVRHMAYPFGSCNEKVRTLVYETGYYSACTTESFIANSNNDMLTLPRINIGMEDSLLDFIFKLYLARSPIQNLKDNIYKLLYR